MIAEVFLFAAAFAPIHGAVVTRDASAKVPPFFPTYYTFGGYPRLQTNISYGTPRQSPPIPTVVDLGSANYWVEGPNATVNYGSPYLGVLGPCNVSAYPFYNYPKSRTASKPIAKDTGYAYGGNGKLVSSNQQINDTIGFGNPKIPALGNVRVALADFTLVKQYADACYDSFEYDHSILGISRFDNPTYPTNGVSFRQNLLDSGAIDSSTMSLWMDKISGVKSTFRGTALFGAVPKDKYSGPLVQLPLSPPEGSYVGYYVKTPQISVTDAKNISRITTLKVAKDKTECLLDTGFGNDNLPVNQNAFLKANGLVLFGGYPAFNGPCDSIPRSATLNFTFAGHEKGKKVTVRVPLRNYARGNTDYLNSTSTKCGLSFSISTYNDCVLGAPFFTAAFLAVNDDNGQLGMAQGGVSKGAQQGTEGLGEVTWIKRNQSLPFTK